MNLSSVLIKSANNYYNYLNENNKGIISYSVKHIERIHVSSNIFLYRFKINSKLNSIEDLQLQVFDKIYKNHQAKIQIYDEENKSLVIQISSDIINDFSDISKLDVNNIKIIYDLKFLIKNVQKWFENFELFEPSKPTIVEDNKDIQIFNNCSKEQINAIKTALTKPISYIWGAPGTGKTQYVLTNSVLNYTIKNKKVIIVAPTNNALEQVMSSLIKVTDKIGVSRNKIIRLGTPTKKFFNNYSEICENEKLWKVLEIFNNKINLLDEVLKYRKLKTCYEKYSKEILENLKTISKYESDNLDIEEDIDYLQKELIQLTKRESSINLNYDNILTRKKYFIDKMETFSFKFKQLFNKKEKLNYQSELNKISAEEDLTYKELSEIRKEIKNLRQKIKTLKNNVQQISLDSLNKNLHELDIDINFSLTKFKDIEDIVKTKLKNISDEIKSNSQIYSEYENDSEEKIQSKLKDLFKEKTKASQKTTQNRINNALIMGMTLDFFISSQLPLDDNKKFKEKLKFNAEHIFLDEAGYSCLAKALPIFSTMQPITLLGDHLQLPPVCELDDSMLESNPEFSVWLQSSLYALDFFKYGINYLSNVYKTKKSPDFTSLNKENLTLTYRFGQNLLDVLSEEIYHLKMQSAPNKENIEILFIDTPKTSVSLKKRENQDEVKSIYNYLISHREEDIAILSPYRNQIFELKKKCWLYCKDNIMTIHGSQGQEWDTVILSVCDTYDKFFTDSCNPKTEGKLILNTAISRVKNKLIMVCDYNYWINQPNQLICKLLKIAKPYRE